MQKGHIVAMHDESVRCVWHL